MNEYVVKYEERKNRVLDFLQKTKDFFATQEGTNAENNVKALEKLSQNIKDNRFSIVLVGEFSAGKSTFLNALMHKRILPSFTGETTATVNFLMHKKEAPHGEAGIVYYVDGTQKVLPDLSVPTLEKYVSTRGNEGDKTIATTVDRVELFLESKFLENGVTLVDSPGLNGVADNHREITEQQIKESHAAIFMFTADRPGSRTDFEYLADLRKNSNNIFIVLNKINVIKNNEGETVESVVKQLQKNYQKQFPEAEEFPKIYPVAGNAALSARDASVEYQNEGCILDPNRKAELEEFSRMELFEERLWKFLTEGEKTRGQLLEPIQKAEKFLESQRSVLQNNIQVLSGETTPEEIAQHKLELEDKIRTLQDDERSKKNEISNRVALLFKEQQDAFSADCNRMKDFFSQNIGESIDEVNEYAEDLPRELQKHILRKVKNIEENIEVETLAIANSMTRDYIASFNADVADKGKLQLVIDDKKLEQVDVQIGLDKYDAQLKEIQEEIANLESQAEDLDDNILRAQKIESERAKLEAKSEKLKEEKFNIAINYPIPAKETESRIVPKTRNRRGLFGWLAQIFAGKKEYKEEEIVDLNREEREKALEKQKTAAQQVEEEIKEAKKALDNLPDEVYLESEKRKEERLNRKLEKFNEKYDQIMDKYQEEVNKKAEQSLRKLKKSVEYYLEDTLEVNMDIIKKYFREQQQEYIQAVHDLVNIEIQSILAGKQKELDALNEEMTAKAEIREQRLKQCQQDEGLIKELLVGVVDLEAELDNNLNDKIEEEEIE